MHVDASRANNAQAGAAPVYDDDCRRFIARCPATAVPWWLMASFLYYHVDVPPILSDGMFDELSVFLAERWDSISHPHKDIISRADLAAGSGYAISKDRYPAIVVNAARRIVAEGVQELRAEPAACTRAATDGQFSLL